jgi:hypothetical protein
VAGQGGRSGDGAADGGGVAGHFQVDDGGLAAGSDLVHLGEFLAGGGEADLQALGFAGPAFALGFADAGGQVVADLGQSWPLGGVGAQQRAADAGLTEMILSWSASPSKTLGVTHRHRRSWRA